METFKIEIQEILSKTIEIQAKNMEEAIEKVNQMYRKEEIVLDYSNFVDKKIIPSTLKKEEVLLKKENQKYKTLIYLKNTNPDYKQKTNGYSFLFVYFST